MKRMILILLGLILVAAGGVSFYQGWTDPILQPVLARLGVANATSQSPGHASHQARPTAVKAPLAPRLTADGLLEVDARQQKALGLRTTAVQPQTEPILLELLGSTAYDPDSLTKVRPRFDTLVREVHAALGHTVKEGDPLVELYSAALAEAKTTYETRKTQWEHDQRVMNSRRPLAASGAISQQLWADTQNSEIQSRLEYKVARDKLLIYGLTDEQIEALDTEEGAKKAEMTIRSPASGVVISRDAVPGNLYDPADVLLTIAPLDHLWVWSNVYESDLELVKVGQVWEVQFPFLNEQLKGRVEYVADQVDPQTHAVRIRGTIPNPGGKLKSEMLVRTLLEIPPEPGRTVIPRIAMITTEDANYVFVQRSDAPETFERRLIQIARETSDQVVVAEGLQPGETVVTTGALLLAQIYEDRKVAWTGSSS